MRTKERLFAVLSAALLAGGLGMLASGCAWQRTVINGNRELDLSKIEVGRSTWKDVLHEFGPPDVPIKNLRAFTYTSTDVRATGFRIGYILYLPFRWTDRQKVDDVLVELNDAGVVTTIVRTRRDTIRPPLQGESKREPTTIEVIQ